MTTEQRERQAAVLDGTAPPEEKPKPEDHPQEQPKPNAPAPAGDPRVAQSDAEADYRDLEKVREKAAGELVDPERKPESVWIDPMEAFLSEEAKVLPSEEYPIQRLNTKLKITAIPTKRYNVLVRQHTQRRMDKNTREMVEVTKEDELKAALIAEAVTNINWQDKRLMAFWGAVDIYGLVERMFLKGEIEQLALRIAELSGYERTVLEEAAGNS